MNRIETKIIVMVTNKLAAAKDCEAKTELIEELSENLYQRYMDLTNAGVPEEEALQQAMDNLGDVNELLEYLAYLSEDEGGAAQDAAQGTSYTYGGTDSAEQTSSYNKKDWSASFNTDKWEKGIEDIVTMAMSAARSAVDMASDAARNVSKELKEKYPDGFVFEFNGKRGWAKSADGTTAETEDGTCEIRGDDLHSLDVNLTNGDIHLMVDESADLDLVVLSGDTSGVQFVVGDDGVLSIRQHTTASSSVLFGRGGGWTDLDITIPAKAWKRIGLQSTAGDITLEDSLVCEALYLNTKSGDVTLDGGTSLVNAEKMAVRTLSGDVNASNLVGSLYINSASGDVTVEDCDLQTCGVIATSGDIRVECRAKEMNCSSSSGDIEVTCIDQAPDAVKVATTSGDVRLEMAGGEGFTLAYRTVSGDIDYDVDDLDQWTEQRDSNKKGALIYRSGQPTQVQISTVSGDIDLTLEP